MIERLYVHNYRCFENFTLDLKGKPSALVIGRNGSGKSTLRHVFGLFQAIARGPNLLKGWVDASDFTQGRTDVPMSFDLGVTLAGRRMDYAISFERDDGRRAIIVAEERMTLDGEMVFSREYTQAMLAGGTTFGVDAQIAMLPFISGTIEGAVSQLRHYLASLVLVAPTPARIGGFSEQDTAELSETAENLVAWMSWLLGQNPSLYASIARYLTQVMPDFASFTFLPRGERGKALQVHFVIPEKGGARMSVDFKKLSDGEKCFFLCATMLAFNRSEVPVFCFWDEPDNHLSLPEVGQFITELRKSTSQHGQFIASSHHPETIRRFSDENTFVFTRNSHLEPTVVRPLTELPYGTDLVRALVRGEVI